MIYLDYSATTPVNEEVLNSFVEATKKYIGNPNSLHKLGVDANHLIELSTEQIKKIFNLNDVDIIYTSGASESNNLALKGIALKYSNRGKHIITTKLEHSSINSPIKYLEDNGFEISYVKLDSNGLVVLDDLKSIIRDDTILVSICAVNSELGIRQPIEEIGKIINNYNKCYFHVDMTQAVGKVKIDLSDVDLFSFSAHKFYGTKGIGALIKKSKIIIEPIIHGGKSTTIYRSGTPSLPLIVSMAKALRLIYQDIDKKYMYVEKLCNELKEFLISYDKVTINSNNYSIPYILNISILDVKPETFLHALEQNDIYISTKSACSKSDTLSESVYSVTKDTKVSSHSIRISLSYLTTEEEINIFKKAFDECYRKLTNLK